MVATAGRATIKAKATKPITAGQEGFVDHMR